MSNKLINFGKYKDQPVEVLLEDEQYRAYLLEQDWFKPKYTWIYNAINNAMTLEDTPEHNTLQMKFMDNDYSLSLARYHFSIQPESKKKLYKKNLILCSDTTKITDDIIQSVSKEVSLHILNDFVSHAPLFSVYGRSLDKLEGESFEQVIGMIKKKFALLDLLGAYEAIESKKLIYAIKVDENKQLDKKLALISIEILEYVKTIIKPVMSLEKHLENDESLLYFEILNAMICAEVEYEYTSKYWFSKLIKTFLIEKEELIDTATKEIQRKNSIDSVGKPIFEENNIDVKYNYYPSHYAKEFGYSVQLMVELKPVISEDYMSILRKAIKDKVNIVYCNNFSATSTTLENVKKVYKEHKIDFICFSDIKKSQYTIEHIDVENRNMEILAQIEELKKKLIK